MSKQEIMYTAVQDWIDSGLTQQEFCQESGLKVPTFNYWVSKYKKQQQQDTPKNFITIEKPVSFGNSMYEIVYPNGVVLRVNTSNLSELATLLKLV